MINWAMSPTTNIPSKLAKKGSDYISPTNRVNSPIRGFLSGALEGAGKLGDDMTSPMSLAGLAIGASPWMRGSQALQSLGRVNEFRPGIGIGPSELPADLISRGSESIYNTARNIPQAAKSAEDAIYDIIMRRQGMRR